MSAKGGKSGHRFSNWINQVSCEPEQYFEPEDRDEVKQIVQDAQRNSRKVRVVGSGHAMNTIAVSKDYMISLKHMSNIVNIDKENLTVKVEAGATLEKINTELHKNGLALRVLPAISKVTIGGALATGTHGSGEKHGAMSSTVISLELMTAQGEVLNLSRDSDKDVFLAACTSLGALGILLTVTLQCVPAFRLRHQQNMARFDDALDNLEEHVKSSEHFTLSWYPYTDWCCLIRIDHTEKPIERPSSWFLDVFVGYHLLQFLYWLSTFCTWLLPPINKLYRYLSSKPLEFVDQSYNVLHFETLFSGQVMEWAISREKTADVFRNIRETIEQNHYPVHIPLAVRFAKSEDVYLAATYGREAAFIQIITYRPYGKDVQHREAFEVIEKILLEAGGRPHWSKEHNMGQAECSKMYPKWKEFCQIRRKLDPNGMFVNEYIERIFGSDL